MRRLSPDLIRLMMASIMGTPVTKRESEPLPSPKRGKMRAYTVEDARAWKKTLARRRARNRMARNSRRVNRLRCG